MINNDNTENNEDRESTLNTDMPYKMPDPTTGCKLVQILNKDNTAPPDTSREEYVAGLKAKEQDMIKQAKSYATNNTCDLNAKRVSSMLCYLTTTAYR